MQRLLHPVGVAVVLAQVGLHDLAQVPANGPQRAREVWPLDDADVAGVEEGVAHRVDAAGAPVRDEEVLDAELHALDPPLPVGQHLPQVLEAEDAAVAEGRLGGGLEDAVDGRLQAGRRQRVRVRNAAAQVDGGLVLRRREGDGPPLCTGLGRADGGQHRRRPGEQLGHVLPFPVLGGDVGLGADVGLCHGDAPVFLSVYPQSTKSTLPCRCDAPPPVWRAIEACLEAPE